MTNSNIKNTGLATYFYAYSKFLVCRIPNPFCVYLSPLFLTLFSVSLPLSSIKSFPYIRISHYLLLVL